MTQIKKILTAGLIAYLIIAAWQVASHPETAIQALGLGLLFIILVAIAWITDEAILKKAEMVILWICVGLFGVYAILVAGGIV